ncbi:hypothetical protein [Micromonospora zamorensis]|uniref:hypothetical protein n=1 Tax=Micromonospora zamorensis TaxID=709883 RepID=UPI002E2CFC88|nr:hypothetical protein [Micromonospora zamorensis]
MITARPLDKHTVELGYETPSRVELGVKGKPRPQPTLTGPYCPASLGSCPGGEFFDHLVENGEIPSGAPRTLATLQKCVLKDWAAEQQDGATYASTNERDADESSKPDDRGRSGGARTRPAGHGSVSTRLAEGSNLVVF